MYDLLIIGGGPAGSAAGVYAARKRLKTAFITEEWGGQSKVSPEIYNWIGTPSISGDQLAADLQDHVNQYEGEYLDISKDAAITALTRTDDGTFQATTEKENTIEARTVLIATGSSRRKLSVPGAETYEHKGLTYCASCDGPIFSGQDVAVVGGGNAGFEAASQLLAYANSVTLIHRGGTFKADAITTQKVLEHEHMHTITEAEPTKVYGEQFVTGLSYKTEDGEEHDLAVTGVFVEIGMIPNTTYAKDLVPLDDYQRVKIDPWTQRSEVAGIWAAGDCTNIHYHQNNISAGDGVKALEDIYQYIAKL